MARWLWLSVLVVVADQVTKIWISGALRPYELVPVIDGFFNLTLAFNTGAAFSFLAQGGGWQRWLLSGLAVVVTIVLVVWLTRLGRHERWTAAALSLVIGGAVGNLLDRLRLGHVVDFLDFYLGSWHWPAFNVADSAIVVGVAILLLASFRRPAEG
jgi:signal peptidase II